MIKIDNVTHYYNHASPEKIIALDNVSTIVNEGEFIAVLGHNGSGKSTLVKLLNALILPNSGDVFIDGVSTRSDKDLWNIRSKVGMVFQNPDNQLVAPTVEEELAFGPENIGIPREEIIRRIDDSLHVIGLEKFRKSPPHLLSGGQKQKVAIASVLTMYPKYLVLDEPTAMLDPVGQSEVLNCVKKLNEEKGITVILVTQNMSEAILAHRIIVMNLGKIILDNEPRVIFSDVDFMEKIHLEVPPMTKLANRLRSSGVDISANILTVQEMGEALSKIMTKV